MSLRELPLIFRVNLMKEWISLNDLINYDFALIGKNFSHDNVYTLNYFKHKDALTEEFVEWVDKNKIICPNIFVTNKSTVNLKNYISKNCEYIKEITIKMTGVFYGSQFYNILICCTNLLQLNISYVRISDEFIENLTSHCKKLEILEINKKDFSTIRSELTDRSICSLCKNCYNLKVITLPNSNFTSNSIAILTEKFSNLVSLDFSWCMTLTSNGVVAIFKNCNNLKYLNLNRCINIKDSAFKLIPQNHCIETIILSGHNCLTNKSIEMISQKCPELKHLEILTDYDHKITSSSIVKLKKLEKLNIGGSRDKFIDDDLIAIANNLQNLTDLNISNSEKITDLSIFAIVTKLKSLKILQISGCDNISSVGIIAIAKNLPKIEKLRYQSQDYEKYLPIYRDLQF